MAPVTSLPSEIITLIVEKVNKRDLYACAFTNKQFYKTTLPLLWRSPTLIEKGQVAQFMYGLSAVTERHEHYSVGRWLQRLCLYLDTWTDSHLLLLMAHDLSQLEQLRLLSTDLLTESTLAQLPHHCPRLQLLYVWHVPAVRQPFIDAVGQHCLQLVHFEVDDCKKLQGDTYSALRNCPLRTMNIGSPPPSLQTEMVMWDLIIHFPCLTTLKVGMGRDDAPARSIAPLLANAVSAWPYLETLALGNYWGMVRGDAEDPLVAFLRYHPAITRVYFRSCCISNRTLDAIANLALPCLTEWTITHCPRLSPMALRRLIHACPELRFVSFWGCGITSQMFPEAGVYCGKMNYCHPERECHFLHHLDYEDIYRVRLGGDHLDEADIRRIGLRLGYANNNDN